MTKNVSVPEGYKKTELGEIPEEWSIEKLGVLCELITKGTTPTTVGFSYQNTGINFVKIESISASGNFLLNMFSHISEDANKALKRSILKDRDLLFSIAGALGRVAIVNSEILPANTNQALAIIRLKEDQKTDIKYVYFYLKGPQIQKHIDRINVQSAQANLSLENINNFKIALPQKEEQQKIASILSKVDEQIEQTEQIIEKTEILKKGLMQKLLTKGIGHTEFKTFLFKGQKIKMPKSWNISTINSHLVEYKGGAPLKPTDFAEDGFRVFPKKAIAKGGILRIKESEQSYARDEFAKKHKSSIVDKNYLITTLRDLVPSGPNIGLIVKINDDYEYLMAQGVYGFKLRETLDNNFLIQYSNSLIYRKIMNKIMVGSTQVHIRNGDFFDMKIPLPPLGEQQKIASILSKVDSQIQDNQRYLHKLQELKKGLMQDLLTGKVRVCA
ncbi:restriction endonuclease subunit S [Methanosarcina sp. WWM596]|uniref:restriction endonuclease subunit S n=1 Tax=Methanosarcina sp. WWM596 TaxID=1434103 RepID=UPI0006156C38|nr:restriction endonuclease subunit S [Methanosarcina sp. WWM596]AKB18730.1 Type I restriction-modification system, specificity subunit S [Methanosarcina sp. WWM596]